MALIKCAECGKEISQKAASCPGCGAVPKENLLQKNMGCGGLIFLLLAVFVIFSIWPAEPPPSPSSKPAPALVSPEIRRLATEKFTGLPGISRTEWLDGDFIIQAAENGSSWEPVADSTCAWIRSQGAPAGFSVIVLDASAVANKRWEQLAHQRCN